MTLSKLALKNLKNQFNYYFIYFICMMFSVIVYYSFVSMSFDERLLVMISENLRVDIGLRSGSFMIVLFIIVFIFSANTFFIKRRKREIGLYSLLGMRRRQISGLLFIENMILGVMALFMGIVLGIILSKLFSMILLKFMHVSVMSHFIVSFSAIKNTADVFLIILMIVSIRTAMTIYRFKLITLFKADQQGNGRLVVKWYNWVLGLLGVFLLITGYYLAKHFLQFGEWTKPFFTSDDAFLVGDSFIILFLCVAGTYLVFTHFLVIVLKMISNNERYYYRDIHMVTNGNLGFNFKKNGRSLATIAVLSGTALASIGGAASFQSYVLNLQSDSNPTSYAVEDSYYPKLKDFLNKEGATITNEVALHFKVVGGEFYSRTDFGTQTSIGPYDVISISNYNQVKKVVNQMPSINLNQEMNIAILGSTNQYYSGRLIKYSKIGILGNVGTVNVQTFQPDFMGNRQDMRISDNTLVVTDKVYQDLASSYQYSYYLVDVKDSNKNESLANDSSKEFNDELEQTYGVLSHTTKEKDTITSSIEIDDKPINDNFSNHYYEKKVFSVRYLNETSLKKSTGLLIYVAVFLGMVFMMATGSIIALKQLSEAEDQVSNYDLLKKIGTPNYLIKRNVYTQNKIIFFVPLVVSLVHAYFAIQVLMALIGIQNMKLTYISVSFLMLIYTILYFITSATYYRIINK